MPSFDVPIPLPASRQFVTSYVMPQFGTNAARPPAAGLPEGMTYFETDTQLVYQVEGAAWKLVKIGQTPIFVASANATAPQKAAALMSGGTICDGTSDDADITAALALGNVVCPVGPGPFSFGAQVVVGDGKTLLFRNESSIQPAAAIDCFKVQQGGTLLGNKALIDYRTPAINGNPIVIETFTDPTARPLNYRVEGWRLRGKTGVGTGRAFSIPVKAGNSWIWGGQFRDFIIEGFEYGVYLDATGAATWINSNLFDNFTTDDCVNPLYLTAVGGLGLDANMFRNWAMQWSAFNAVGISIMGSITRAIRNLIEVVYWDWQGGAGSAMDLRGSYNTVYHSGLPTPATQITLAAGGGDGVYNTLVDESGMYSDRQVAPLSFKKGADITISGDAITVPYAAGYIVVDGEGGAADNLSNIYGARRNQAAVYLISPKSAARAITVKHGIGNIKLKGGTDKVLSQLYHTIALMYDGTIGFWVEQWDSI